MLKKFIFDLMHSLSLFWGNFKNDIHELDKSVVGDVFKFFEILRVERLTMSETYGYKKRYEQKLLNLIKKKIWTRNYNYIMEFYFMLMAFFTISVVIVL